LPAQKPTSVQINRIFNVPPDAVWRAWTEESMVRRWFGSDPKGKVLSAKLDVRTGGRFEVTFADSNGTSHTCGGVYADVEPVSKFGFSWQWLSEPGVETFVTVRLEPREAGTLMRFEHARLFQASMHNYEVGWQQTFDKLERALTAAL
jgi:uncharacterized protein YndB with AHSA1/START domain